MKKECTKFQKWLKKKGISISFVFFYKSNIVDVNFNTWWIDYDFITHISNIL